MSLDRDPAALAAFYLAAKYVFVLLFLLALGAVRKSRRPAVLVAAAAGFGLYAWAVTQIPLERLWSLEAGYDRIFNLASYATAATGHSPWESWQVAGADLEPFWRLAMRLFARGDPERAAALLHSLPALLLLALPLSFYLALGRRRGESAVPGRWEAALAAYAVVLFSSSPLERFGVFQTFWQMRVLLKPNHAFALVLLPWLVRFAIADRLRTRVLGGGLTLGALAWVFLVDWLYVVSGLGVYVLASLYARKPEEARWASGALALSLLLALPYLVFLSRNYGWEQGGIAAARLWDRPGYELGYVNVFSVTLEHGILFFFSAAGIAGMALRRNREDGLWLALLAGTVPVWLAQFVLFHLERSGEPDELYLFARFLLAVATGKGIFFVLQWSGELFDRNLAGAPAICGLLLLLLPYTLAYWWNPPAMDRYFGVALEPVEEEIRELAAWFRRHTPPDAVVMADGDTSAWISALSGRRAFLNRQRPPRDYAERRRLERALLGGPDEEAREELRRTYRVSHLVLEPQYLAVLGVDRERIAELPWLEPELRTARFEVFRIRYEAAR